MVLVPLHATPTDQPPPLTPARLLTEWSWEWWMALGIAIAAALYIAGLVVLHRRGDRWPVPRSLSFLLGGLGSIGLATMSALGTYDTVLFSVHIVQHMILMMVAPMFLALGAPVTLALRTLPPRPRTMLLAVLHSRVARVLTFAPLTLALFIATPFALYYSPFYEISLRSGLLACVSASALHHHWLPADVATDGHRPRSRKNQLSAAAADAVPDAALPCIPWHLDHELDHADRRELVSRVQPDVAAQSAG